MTWRSFLNTAPGCLLISTFLAFVFPTVLYCSGIRTIDPAKGISADIFGPKSGRFHPFILLQETYTDNLYKTESNTKDDFITVLSPGIWVAIPGARVKPVNVESDTDSPGGLKLSRMTPDTIRKFQAYALYSAKFVNYSNHSDNDHVDHSAQALLRYNFNSGISVDLLNIFTDQEEEAGNGISDTFYRSTENLFNSILGYRAPSENLKLKLDYKNYRLDYKDAAADYRDRKDNSAYFSIACRIKPKTFLFMGYGFSDIDFVAANNSDSKENEIYSGLSWNMSGKTKGVIKIGYLEKNFDQPGLGDQDDISIELQSTYSFSPETSLKLNGYRKFNESDISSASSYLSTGAALLLKKSFSPKWSVQFHALYEYDNYNEMDRNDDFYSLSPTIRFTARRWLIFDFEYTYEINDSNIQIYDYERHQFFLGASLVM